MREVEWEERRREVLLVRGRLWKEERGRVKAKTEDGQLRRVEEGRRLDGTRKENNRDFRGANSHPLESPLPL